MFAFKQGFFLDSTAEVPVTNLRSTRFLLRGMPVYILLTHLVRKEAGSAGKDTRGLLDSTV